MDNEFSQVLNSIIDREFEGSAELLRESAGFSHPGIVSRLRQGQRITEENLAKLSAAMSPESRFSLLTAAARTFLPSLWSDEVLRAATRTELSPAVEQALSILSEKAVVHDEVGEWLVDTSSLLMGR